MARIGIMGGTFNPIHNGHIGIAKAAFQQFSLDEVWFMPNHIPAYKSDSELISGEDRLAMVRLAIRDFPEFKTCELELKREGKTYTYQTMELLSAKYPEHRFFFILGADSLYYFDKWIHPEVIVEHAVILAACRDDRTPEEMKKEIQRLNRLFGKEAFFLIDCPELTCSSSEIREKYYNLQGNVNPAKELFREILPETVREYIIAHQLYIGK